MKKALKTGHKVWTIKGGKTIRATIERASIIDGGHLYTISHQNPHTNYKNISWSHGQKEGVTFWLKKDNVQAETKEQFMMRK